MPNIPNISRTLRGHVQPFILGQEEQQRLEDIRQGIWNAVNTLYFEATTLSVASSSLPRHFSQTICPMVRHIPKEDIESPAGWVSGHTSVR